MTDGDIQVVEPYSSKLDYVGERAETIDANHVNMCRFRGPEDNGYIKFKQALENHINSILSQTKEAGS